MLKFFRRIRKNFLSEGNTGKYLKYAIGEIILVVIGILIALQINNWNEGRKQDVEEQRLLAVLSADLDKDIDMLNDLIISSDQRQVGLEAIFDLLAEKSNYDTEEFIRLCLESMSYEGYFKSNTGTYDESVASGTIKFIQDDGLSQEIFDYYRDVKVNYTDNNAKKLVYEYLYPIYFEKFMASQEVLLQFGNSNRLPKLDLEQLGRDPKFLGIVMQKRASEKFQRRDWVNFLKKAESLRASIENIASND